MGKSLFGLAFGEAALKYLDRMPPGKIRAQVAKKAKALIYDPHPAGSEKVAGLEYVNEPVWRVYCGDYRILYVIREIEVVVLDIAKREDMDK